MSGCDLGIYKDCALFAWCSSCTETWHRPYQMLSTCMRAVFGMFKIKLFIGDLRGLDETALKERVIMQLR